MKKLAFVLALACGCDQAPAPPAPPPPAKPEPDRIVVQHILISFNGAPRIKQTRSKQEAEALAKELLERVRKGENFQELMKRYSDDTGPGEYAMANHHAAPSGPQESPRKGMVPAFGNVGFQLAVDEIGLASHDPQASPFGWHIIKRVK